MPDNARRSDSGRETDRPRSKVLARVAGASLIALIVATLAPVGVAGGGPQGIQAGRQPRVTKPIRKLKPGKVVLQFDKESEAEFIDAELTIDDEGKSKLRLGGKLGREMERVFFIIDVDASTIRTFKMGNPARDAERIRKFLETRGMTTSSETDLRAHFELQDRRARDRFNESRRRDRAPDDNQGGPSAPCEADPDTGVLECAGSGYAKIETWEPAKYWFPVTHLTETWTSAWWNRPPLSANYDGACWANPFTFVATYWLTIACVPSLSNSAVAFDAKHSARYINWNFVLDAHAVTVDASAGVMHAAGSPNWYYTHHITNLGLFNFYEGLFLKGEYTGWANEWGCTDCFPAEYEVRDCENQVDFHSWDWDQCSCIPGASPIVVDLDGDGLELTNWQDGVSFDLLADSIKRRVGWTAANVRDAFLVLDRNGNGVVDDSRELFGNFSPQPEPGRREERNGFRALSVFDTSDRGGDGDGRITERDRIFDRLRLWIDANHNGVSEASELAPLTTHGLRAIDLDYKKGKKVDEHGNAYRYRAKAAVETTETDKRKARANRMAYDIYFVYMR
jgi:hypothetical protein